MTNMAKKVIKKMVRELMIGGYENLENMINILKQLIAKEFNLTHHEALSLIEEEINEVTKG